MLINLISVLPKAVSPLRRSVENILLLITNNQKKERGIQKLKQWSTRNAHNYQIVKFSMRLICNGFIVVVGIVLNACFTEGGRIWKAYTLNTHARLFVQGNQCEIISFYFGHFLWI